MTVYRIIDLTLITWRTYTSELMRRFVDLASGHIRARFLGAGIQINAAVVASITRRTSALKSVDEIVAHLPRSTFSPNAVVYVNLASFTLKINQNEDIILL